MVETGLSYQCFSIFEAYFMPSENCLGLFELTSCSNIVQSAVIEFQGFSFSQHNQQTFIVFLYVSEFVCMNGTQSHGYMRDIMVFYFDL